MAGRGGNPGSASGGQYVVQAGFAKLQGEDFEYYMQKYSILLGRGGKRANVDVDLSRIGGGMNISRAHARIFYDFPRRRFALEVLGKNGCFVEGVLHLPGGPPVKLDSQDLLQIGDKKFYFLLPVRSILGAGSFAPRRGPLSSAAAPPRSQRTVPPLPPPLEEAFARTRVSSDDDHGGDGGDGGDREEEKEETDQEEESDDDKEDDGLSTGGGQVDALGPQVVGAKAGSSVQSGKEAGETSKANKEGDHQQRLQLEEKDVIASVATVLSDLCGPGEWTAVEKLHAVLLLDYGNTWHQSWVRRYLTSEDWPSCETQGREWFGLLALLRKYPEHFVINIRSKGKTTKEYVSLVSLIE